jgi:dihydrofolate synthase/folylpolyglutamate synthase
MKRGNLSQLDKILESLGGERRIDYSLERFSNALESLGNPEKSVQTLVIAGTNGKGTVSLLVSSTLKAAGFRTGTYLSPHLQSVSERFLHNLSPIEETQLEGLAVRYAPTASQFNLTYFEFLTLLYFGWAKEQSFDFSVLECGLGGRLDATNVTDPIASVITNISLDHQEYLGSAAEDILREKMGILRPEALLFTGVREPKLLEAIDKRCLELDAIPYFSKEIRTQVLETSVYGQKVTLNGYPFMLNNPSPGALENATLAFLLLRIAFPKIPMETLQRAFASTRNPGRMEIVQENPRVILSGDHNLAGVECLLATLEKTGISRPKIICAFSPDKPFEEMYQRLAGVAGDITLTSVPRLRSKLPGKYFSMGRYVEDPRLAVEQVLAAAAPHDTVLITGSLYLIGELRKMWKPEAQFLAETLS